MDTMKHLKSDMKTEDKVYAFFVFISSFALIMGAVILVSGMRLDNEFVAALGFVPVGISVLFLCIMLWERFRSKRTGGFSRNDAFA